MRPLHTTRRAGFTIIELTISTSIFIVIAITLMGAVKMANTSTRTVAEVTSSNAEVRASSHALMEELRTTTASELTITPLADGNHQVDFRVPVMNGATFDWGVFDPAYGPNPVDQNKVGWSLRYTVDVVNMGGGQLNRRLLRQVFDDAGLLQDQDVLVEGLRNGAGADPGFQMTPVGDMWNLAVTTEGRTDNTNGRKMEFHVRLHN